MNLFDVTRGIATHIGPRNSKKANDKPRQANQAEIKAYLIWLADRRGVWLPHDAEYQLAGVWSKSAGEYVLPMPGYGQEQLVTMETLDEAGEVLTSQTLPVEPKKGGVIWDREAVRKACGPIAKPAKAKRGKVADPIAVVVAAPVAVETQEASPPTVDKPEPAIAPSAAPAVDLDAITARLDALEAALATLSAESTVLIPAPSNESAEIITPPTARAKRTAAHERAIRRAWQERKARRGAQGGMAIYARRIDALETELRLAKDEQVLDKQAFAETYARAEQFARRGNQHRERRLRTTRRARRMIAAVRARIKSAEERYDRAYSWGDDLRGKLHNAECRATSFASAIKSRDAELARLKRDMADPMQPERASDISRLVGERDTARTALAAMAARAERAEQTVNAMADRFEGLVSRVTRAEAALRQAKAA